MVYCIFAHWNPLIHLINLIQHHCQGIAWDRSVWMAKLWGREGVAEKSHPGLGKKKTDIFYHFSISLYSTSTSHSSHSSTKTGNQFLVDVDVNLKWSVWSLWTWRLSPPLYWQNLCTGSQVFSIEKNLKIKKKNYVSAV